jgi:hypothetical protein
LIVEGERKAHPSFRLLSAEAAEAPTSALAPQGVEQEEGVDVSQAEGDLRAAHAGRRGHCKVGHLEYVLGTIRV